MSIKVKTTKKKGGTNALTKYLRKTISPEFMYIFTGKMPPNHPDYKKGGKISASSLNKMINSSYKSRKDADADIDGYTLDTALSTKKAKVYFDKNGKAVVVHRGTAGTASDWMNNAAYLTGLYKHTDRYKQGKAVQEAAEAKYGAENIDTVGHSQSGILARELGKNTKNIITVNPASLFQKQADNETVIRSSLDPVSFLQQGPVNTIKAETYNPLTEHSSNILQRVDPNTQYGSGFSVRKAHKKEKYLVKSGGNIVSTHSSKRLAEDKMKKLIKLSGGVVVKPNAKLEEMIRKNTRTC